MTPVRLDQPIPNFSFLSPFKKNDYYWVSLAFPKLFQTPTGVITTVSPQKLKIYFKDQEKRLAQHWEKKLVKKCLHKIQKQQKPETHIYQQLYKTGVYQSVFCENHWTWNKSQPFFLVFDSNKKEITECFSGDYVRGLLEWSGIWIKNNASDGIKWGLNFQATQIQQFSISHGITVDTNPPPVVENQQSKDSSASSAIHPDLETFIKMKRMGVPPPAIKIKMSIAGIDGKYLEHPEQYKSKDNDNTTQKNVVPPQAGGKSLFQEMLNFSSLKKPTNLKGPTEIKKNNKIGVQRSGFKPPSIQQLLLLRNRLKKISKKI